MIEITLRKGKKKQKRKIKYRSRGFALSLERLLWVGVDLKMDDIALVLTNVMCWTLVGDSNLWLWKENDKTKER